MKDREFDHLFAGCEEETVPFKDGSKGECIFNKLSVTSCTDFSKIKRFCEENQVQIPAFFTTAFALSLKAYTASEDAFFTCISHGKKAGIWLNLNGKETVISEIRRSEEFLKIASENNDYF